MAMHLSEENLKTVRGASRWGIALALVAGLNMLVMVSRMFDGGLRGVVVDVASLVVMGWQAVAIAVASLAFVSRPSGQAWESGLSGLKTYCKVGALGWLVVASLAGTSCGLEISEWHTEIVDFAEREAAERAAGR